jgi:hypothetical protein
MYKTSIITTPQIVGNEPHHQPKQLQAQQFTTKSITIQQSIINNNQITTTTIVTNKQHVTNIGT